MAGHVLGGGAAHRSSSPAPAPRSVSRPANAVAMPCRVIRMARSAAWHFGYRPETPRPGSRHGGVSAPPAGGPGRAAIDLLGATFAAAVQVLCSGERRDRAPAPAGSPAAGVGAQLENRTGGLCGLACEVATLIQDLMRGKPEGERIAWAVAWLTYLGRPGISTPPPLADE